MSLALTIRILELLHICHLSPIDDVSLVVFQENRKGGPDACEGGPDAPPPPPTGNFLHFLFSEVAFSAFSGKKSAQNL